MPDPLEFYYISIPHLKEPLNSLGPNSWKTCDTDALMMMLILQNSQNE